MDYPPLGITRCPARNVAFFFPLWLKKRSFYVRKEIKTLLIFRKLVAHVSPESWSTWMPRNQYIVFFYSEQFVANVFVDHVFYEPYSSHLARYVWLWSFLKINGSLLRRCCPISTRKQHWQTISPSSSVGKSCPDLNQLNRNNAKINWTQNNEIQVYNN